MWASARINLKLVGARHADPLIRCCTLPAVRALPGSAHATWIPTPTSFQFKASTRFPRSPSNCARRGSNRRWPHRTSDQFGDIALAENTPVNPTRLPASSHGRLNGGKAGGISAKRPAWWENQGQKAMLLLGAIKISGTSYTFDDYSTLWRLFGLQLEGNECLPPPDGGLLKNSNFATPPRAAPGRGLPV